ncbi:MAG: porin [Polaromonas sp.]|nr:porin [Polaromonas sp.]
MNKLNAITAAIGLSMLSATAMAQSSVTLYGIVDAAVVYTTKQVGGSRTSIDAGQLATSRWGMRGSEDLGGGLKANFNLEGTVGNDTGAFGAGFGGNTTTAGTSTVVPSAGGTTSSLFDRQATLGFSGGFGALTLGRQNMVGVDAVASVDPIGFAQPAINPNVAFSALNSGALFSSFGTNDGGAALRQNNSIRYALPNFSGFGGALMYGFGEQAGNSSANTYAGIVGSYITGPFAASLGYSKLNNRTDSQELTLVGGGAKFSISNAFAIRGTYTESEVDATSRKIAVAGVGVDFLPMPALTLTAGYYNIKRSGDLSAKADQVVGLARYTLSKRTTLYTIATYAKAGSGLAADTALGLITATGQTSATRLSLGVFHAF